MLHRDPEAGRVAMAAAEKITASELAAVAGCSQSTISRWTKIGRLPRPDLDGYYDRHRALKAIEKHPKHPTRGQKPRWLPPVESIPVPARVQVAPVGVDEEDADMPRDPETRYRLAKARQEEIKLAKMRETHVELAAVERRLFAVGRLFRDRDNAAVSREVPSMAARLGIEEGKLWRELRSLMHRVHEERATLDLQKMVRVDPEEVVEAPVDEEDPPKPASKPGKRDGKRRAR